MNEMVSPVGAPDYRARMCGLAAIKDLGRCQTIHQIGWEHDMGATSQAQ